MTDIAAIVTFIRSQASLSPIERQVLVNRVSFEPTDGEKKRARDQVMGRAEKTSV